MRPVRNTGMFEVMAYESIEDLSERIQIGKTKEYFREVISSYHNGNYRSAIVMLWTVVVCDIIFKLENLKDLYEDIEASSLLAEAESQQKEKKNNPAWEINLVKSVAEKTSLLDTYEWTHLESLQKLRHLSAHPVLSMEAELYAPDKDTVSSEIRKSLEGVLIKPPFFSQKIFDRMLSDLSERQKPYDEFDGALKAYADERYLSRVNEKVLLNFFKSLWKLVFRIENENCDKNRYLNLEIIHWISAKIQQPIIVQAVKSDPDFYSQFAAEGLPLTCLIKFLADYPDVYKSLKQSAQDSIRAWMKVDGLANSTGFFVKESKDAHLADIKSWIASDNPEFQRNQFQFIFDISDSADWTQEVCGLINKHFAASYSYSMADHRFVTSVRPHLAKFEIKALQELVALAEDNSQIYDRGRAPDDHRHVLKRFRELDKGFDHREYPRFFRGVDLV